MSTRQGRSVGFWAGLLAASMATIAGLRLSEAIDETTGFILMIVPTALLIPLFRAMTRRAPVNSSRAAIRYTKGIMIASVAYMLGLGLAITIHDRSGLEGLTGFIIAMLPVVPIFGMIYVMGRYLAEEQDEYLRYRAVTASMVGLALVLGVGSFWGFLETFEMVPHVPGWWAVPIWAVGMGLGQFWLKIRDSREPAE